jgi:hypothetical protein
VLIAAPLVAVFLGSLLGGRARGLIDLRLHALALLYGLLLLAVVATSAWGSAWSAARWLSPAIGVGVLAFLGVNAGRHRGGLRAGFGVISAG